MPKPQAPILTISLNPALDISTHTPFVRPGPKLRCDAPVYDPGGGGINISRAIAVLGGKTTAIVALGGATGQQLADLLLDEGLVAASIKAPGETRQSLSVTDSTKNEQYRFVLPGPVWQQSDTKAALLAIVSAAEPTGFVVISGSQPPGVSNDFISQLSAALPATVKLVADTSSGPLLAVVNSARAKLSVLRMDAAEAEAVAQAPLTTRAQSADFAQDLVRRGVADTVIIARGPDGSVLATDFARWFCEAAKVPVKSKIGAGDSFVAGYVLALARGWAEPEALSYGVAAASAAVMTPATELCRLTDTEALVKLCKVSEI